MSTTFSDSWHQVAHLRVSLLPTIRVHKQVYREQLWYVLQDSCSEKYYRVQETAYWFLSRLTPKKTVEQVWQDFIEEFPEQAPSQEEILQLLSQLHQMNLLFFRSESNSEFIFERYSKQRQREKLTHLLAFLYFRIPLWNANFFLKRNIQGLRLFFTKGSFLLWCCVIFLGGKAVFDHLDALTSQVQGILALDNLIWLYVSMFILKIFHEMGHAIVCRMYGGNVHNMGIMFIALTPLPYIDASASWSMRNKWQRAFVGAAGMYVELFFAAVAAIIWTQTAPGFINSLAFNMMIIGSISSLAFNGNPLLKFDAYYILSDALDTPNLYQKAAQQWQFLGKKALLRVERAEEPADGSFERRLFYSYGILSLLYRLFVMLVIMLYLADISLWLGALMLLASLYIWILGPLQKLLRYLIKSGEVRNKRLKSGVIALTTPLVVVVLLATLPFPHSLKAPGVVESTQRQTLYAEAGGQLVRLEAQPGQWVSAGQVLLAFEHPELELDYELTGQQLIETRWLLRQASAGAGTEIAALEEQEAFLLDRLDHLEERMAGLLVRANQSGVWLPELDASHLGTDIARNQFLGQVINPEEKRFVSVVSQEQAHYLFTYDFDEAEVRFRGQFSDPVAVKQLRFIPYQRHELPSKALSIHGGGHFMAQMDAQGRALADEPFFEVLATLEPQATERLMDGSLGRIRIELEPKPLLQQLVLSVRQLLQTRYQLG